MADQTDETSNVLTSTVHKVDAYLCRDGSLFLDGAAAEKHEQTVINQELFRNLNIGSIPASGGLLKTRVEGQHFDQVEAYALQWKNNHYGYNPHISTIVQSQGNDGPWSCILTRWSKC